MIKNLNQLRRTLREGTQLEILDHCRPECIGQIRNITLVNTQGFYSTVANQPDASANRGNGGRGPILWWGRAAHWQFADGVCSVFDSEQKHTEEELVKYPCEAREDLWSAGEKRSRKNYYHEDAVGLNKSDFRGGQNLGKAFAGE